MPKVLIIGPRFHYFNASVDRAFRELGYSTEVLAYDNPVHPYTRVNKIRYKLTHDKLAMKLHSRAAFQAEAQARFLSFCPDVVFLMNGDMLLPETLMDWQKSGAKVGLWFFDSMTHILLCEDNIPVADAVFCYEQTDIPLIRQRYGVEAYFLPQAVDTTIYHPLECDKSYDIVFAGDIFHSQKRRQVIQAVVAHYPQLKIKVWGEYKPWYKNLWLWLTRERKDVYMNCNASGQQLNEDYNKARIVLNIHHEQQKDGANPKVYEIAATRSYQICDTNPYIRQLFTQGEVGLYTIDMTVPEASRYDDLFACIDQALQSDTTQRAGQAYEKIVSQHTFNQRIQQCLKHLA